MAFAEVFEPIEFLEGQVPEFPLDMHFPPRPQKVHTSKETTDAIDYVWVPCDTYKRSEQEKVEEGAMQLLLAAANSRNIVVYDSTAKEDYFSKRLVCLLAETARTLCLDTTKLYRRNKLSKIFLDKLALYDEDVLQYCADQEIELVKVDMVKAKEYFLKYLEGVLPTGKRHIVLAVSKCEDIYVMPCKGDTCGLSVLTNEGLLLGAY